MEVNNYNREIRKILFDRNIKGNISEDIDIKKAYEVIRTMIYMTSYSDLYSYFRYWKKTNKLFPPELRDFNELKEINSYDELEKFYENNTDMFNLALYASKTFYDSSAYYKILNVKSLDEDDIKHICKINTLFNQDIDNYNIDVDADYIIDKIIKCNRKIGEEKLLSDSSEFILSLLKVDKINAKKILLELILMDIKSINWEQSLTSKNKNINSSAYSEMLDVYRTCDLKSYLECIDKVRINTLLSKAISYKKMKQYIDDTELTGENVELFDKFKCYELGIK